MLNVFGDSYSTPLNLVQCQDSFWGLAAKSLNQNAINFSRPGFSIDHNIHLLLNNEFNFEDDYFLFGVPPIDRFLVFDDMQNKTWRCESYNILSGELTKIQVDCLENTDTLHLSQMPLSVIKGIRYHSESQHVQSLNKICLVYDYLKNRNAKFMIINLGGSLRFDEHLPFGKMISNKIKQFPECIIFSDAFSTTNYNDGIKPADYNEFGWIGHHGAEGNKNWFNKVIFPKMKELSWI